MCLKASLQAPCQEVVLSNALISKRPFTKARVLYIAEFFFFAVSHGCTTMDSVYHHLVLRQEGAPVMPQRSPEYLAENQAGRLMAVEGPLFALSTTAILLRFYVRIFMLKTFGWDGM
jgi:hypothetical protein